MISICYDTGYYHNRIIVKDGNTKVELDITAKQKVYCQGCYVDEFESNNLFEIIDSVSSDVENSEEYRIKMIKEHFSDVLEAIKEESK